MKQNILFSMILVGLVISFVYLFSSLIILVYQMIQNPQLLFSTDVNLNLKPLTQEFRQVKEQIQCVNNGIENVNQAVITKLAHLEELLFSQLNKFGDASESLATIKNELDSIKNDLKKLGGDFMEEAMNKDNLSGVVGWVTDKVTGGGGSEEQQQKSEQDYSDGQDEQTAEEQEALVEVFDF